MTRGRRIVGNLRAAQGGVVLWPGKMRELAIPAEFDKLMLRHDGLPDAGNEKTLVERFWAWVRREDRL